MKTVSKRFLLTVLLALCWTEVFSQGPDECPCGVYDGSGGGPGSPPPPPPGTCLPCPVSIDGSIMVLAVIALVFGIYIIYRNNLKAKSPI